MKPLSLKTTLVVVIFSLLAFVACKKNTSTPDSEINKQPEAPATPSLTSTDWSEAANSDNPADSAGLIHNLGVDFIVTTAKYASPQITYDTAVHFAGKYFGKNLDKGVFRTTYPIKIMEDILADSSSNWANTINALPKYSRAAKSKLTDLVRLLRDTSSLSDEIIYQDVKTTIVEWESGVVNDRILAANEKAFLLHVSSVARYSTLFWHRLYQQTEGITARTARVTGKRKWWQWLIIGVADVVGTAVGSVTSNAAGITAGVAASGLAYTLTAPDK